MHRFTLIAVVASSLFLAACGGGSDDDPGNFPTCTVEGHKVAAEQCR